MSKSENKKEAEHRRKKTTKQMSAIGNSHADGPRTMSRVERKV